MADQTSLQLVDTDKDIWGLILDKARTLVKSGLLPVEIKTAEACAAIILKGQELKLPAMYSLSNIHVIKGKPTCSAELMLALIYRDHGDLAVRFRETSGTKCVIEYRRRSWPDASTHSFTIEEARTALLANGDNWKKFPGAMLRARCLSAVARMAFPDSIGGMHTPEEMGATVRVDGDVVVYDGEVVEAEGRVVERPELSAETSNEQPAKPATKAEPAKAKEPIRAALDGLHAKAQKVNIDHEGLKAIAAFKFGVTSTTELQGEALYKMNKILDNPEAAAQALYEATESGGQIIDVTPSPDAIANLNDFDSRHPAPAGRK